MSVAMLRAIMEGQSGLPPRWFWNAISNGHFLNFVAAWYREARDVAPRAPLSLSIWVHELVDAEQYSSHMVGRLRPNSSCGACRPALGNPLGRFHIFRQVASNLESMGVVALGASAMRQWVYIILELAPYSRNRCLIPGGRGVVRIALLMLARVSRVHARCALGHRDTVRAVPR
jgi:hypothetical protein